MKGDYTRLSFDQTKQYRGVLMQQGRPQLDADWNEQVQIAEYRYAGFFRNLVGHSGAPRSGGMELKLGGNNIRGQYMTLSPGCYYVNGLLIENASTQTLPLPLLEENKMYLWYLDVWSREVTAAEDADLIEPALEGGDTTTRLKTEWMVRCRMLTSDDTKLIETWRLGDWPEAPTENWQKGLSTATLALASTQLTSKDNRLYRLELHQGNEDAPTPSFKWSRDNASVTVAVEANGGMLHLKNFSQTVMDSLKGAAWLEICDAVATRQCLPGIMVRGAELREDGSLPLPAGLDLSAPVFLRSWDGFEDIPAIVGKEVAMAGRAGLVFELEQGLQVLFPNRHTAFHRSGDYWLILVRDGQVVNWPKKVNMPRPPDGPRHHFAALASMIGSSSGNKQIVDLRALFTPLSHPDLSTSGDVCIGGRLGLGTQRESYLDQASLTIIERQDGNLLSFRTSGLSSRGSISHANGALCIRDSTGKGLSLRTGRVGIGVDSPKNKLDIAGSIAIGTGYAGLKTVPANSLAVEGSAAIGTNDPGGYRLKVVGGDVRLAENGKQQGLFGIGKLVAQNSLGFFADDKGNAELMNLDASRLSLKTEAWLNKKNLYLGQERNMQCGLGWYGSGKRFAELSVDGPVVFGQYGGALGLKGYAAGDEAAEKAVLRWNKNGINVNGNLLINGSPPFVLVTQKLNNTVRTASAAEDWLEGYWKFHDKSGDDWIAIVCGFKTSGGSIVAYTPKPGGEPIVQCWTELAADNKWEVRAGIKIGSSGKGSSHETWTVKVLFIRKELF